MNRNDGPPVMMQAAGLAWGIDLSGVARRFLEQQRKQLPISKSQQQQPIEYEQQQRFSYRLQSLFIPEYPVFTDAGSASYQGHPAGPALTRAKKKSNRGGW